MNVSYAKWKNKMKKQRQQQQQQQQQQQDLAMFTFTFTFIQIIRKMLCLNTAQYVFPIYVINKYSNIPSKYQFLQRSK